MRIGSVQLLSFFEAALETKTLKMCPIALTFGTEKVRHACFGVFAAPLSFSGRDVIIRTVSSTLVYQRRYMASNLLKSPHTLTVF